MSDKTVGTDINQVEITSLSHIHGQPQVQELLRVSIDAFFQNKANNEKSTCGPFLLLGPSGVGKSLTAKAIHCELANLRLIESNGEMLNNTAELISALLTADENTTVFIDECQALSTRAQHILLTAISEKKLYVRILTKNAAVVDDFDIIEKYRSRVILGLSITSTNDKMSSILEPNASPITERMKALKLARSKGIRVYSMLCPLIAGIANSRAVIDELVQFGEEIGSEEFFAETVNRRGKALPNTQNVLTENDFAKEAKAVEAIRHQAGWSEYAVELIRDVQASMRKYSDIDKLKFLLYPSNLLPEDEAQIKKDDKGVVWL